MRSYAVLSCIIAVMSSVPVAAEMIAVNNPGFEAPVGGGSSVDGWTDIGGTAASDHNRVEVDANAPEGGQVASLRGLWTTPSAGGITQDTAELVAAGRYTLTFSAASRNTDGTAIFAGLYGGSPATSNFLGGSKIELTGSDYGNYLVTALVSPGDALIGQTLGIQFMNSLDADPLSGDYTATGSGGNRLSVDNVSLQYSAVPEPSAALCGLLLLGGALTYKRFN